MATNRIENENNERNGIVKKAQPYVLLFVVVFAVLLVVVPLLPGVISNFVYAFSGAKPKIYWYLSRSAGFVALTILWVSMAMGLTITNKLARRWPGTPAAFAVHQYVSLLGLAFAVYHALVLMGDHFTDFSLPRLAAPFSIAYQRFWVGLGQTGFYIWVIVILSFYARKYIGQKAWRLIHFANFAVYAMGWLHGVFTGWDAQQTWAQWYYWLSGAILLVLVVHRVREARPKKEAVQSKAVRRPTPQQMPSPVAKPTAPGVSENVQLETATASAPGASEPASITAADPTKEITKPRVTVQPVEARVPENVPQPVVQEKEPAPAPEKDVSEKPEVVEPPKPKVQRERIPYAAPVEQSVSVLRIQKLFNEIRPPEPLPEKPIQIPILRIQLDLLAEQLRAESPWDKVSIDQPPVQREPSRLLSRLKENLPQKQEDTLKIRPRKTVVEEDQGNI